MSKNLRYAVILFSICAVCALILALANSVTAPVIAVHAEETRQAALSEIAVGNKVGQEEALDGKDGIVSRMKLESGGKLVGYLLTLKGNGYGGEFTMMASFSLDGKILAAKMLSDGETPGLGKKSEESWYMTKFIGTGTKDKPVPTSKGMLAKADSDAVSGASVTFGGVSKVLAAGSAYVLSAGGAK
jgi:electron transport complex protein RnfG